MSPSHDYTISNASGSSVRNDIQSAVRALNSNNSGSSAPTSQLTEGSAWSDTSNHIFKRQDRSGSWISLRRDDGTVLIPDGSASSPGLTPSDDSNTGLYSPAADQIAISANGSARLTVTGSAVTSTEPIGIPDGSATLPAITPSDDTNTGLFSSAADTLNVSTGGTERLKLSTNLVSRVDLDLDNRKSLRLRESGVDSTNYIALRAPSSVSSNVTLDLPGSAGSSGQCLITNGSGVLSWSTEVPEAVKLKTARTINGVAFDGSQNISIDSEFLSYTSVVDTTARVFSSNTWTDVGLSITYTPQSSSSTIIIASHLNLFCRARDQTSAFEWSRFKHQFIVTPSGGSASTVGEFQKISTGAGINHEANVSYGASLETQYHFHEEYTNTDTTQKTFKVQLREEVGTLEMNDNQHSQSGSNAASGRSFLTLREVL